MPTQNEELMQNAEMPGDLPVSLSRTEMERVERLVESYVPEHQKDDLTDELNNLVEEILQQKLRNKKTWLKATHLIQDAAYCDVLISQIQATQRALNPNWQSETPRG